jgi:hypothetical protein
MRRVCWTLVGMLAVLVGCAEPKFVPVEGTVTVDGQPAAGLFVQFEPLAEGSRVYPGPGSVGRTDAQGKYRLSSVPERHDGAVPGKHMVRIYVEGGLDDDELALKNEPIRNRKDRPKQLPARYNDASELTFEVQRGRANRADFSLTTK